MLAPPPEAPVAADPLLFEAPPFEPLPLDPLPLDPPLLDPLLLELLLLDPLFAISSPSSPSNARVARALALEPAYDAVAACRGVC
ncbi:hypothetical protein [Mycobacterium simiae]|uniref:hypothetical protein n=1 Tax=Mycobacterium simiae TaxID=1784 RepID=UPI000417385C|nr:hypothetical protein [Mycobacterium simiae]PLV50467.1 hypothetical protein X011_13415 [Mycobacterium tuberculosis variant microti OV254]